MPDELKTERLLLCEGIDDAAFLRALINHRALGGFDVVPVRDAGGIAGVTGFRPALIGIISVTGFAGIKHVGLVADGDTHYNVTLSTVRRQIEAANGDPDVAGRYGVPAQAYQQANGNPRTTILMLPASNTAGAMETLLWPALGSNPAFNRAVGETEGACGTLGILQGANAWPPAQKAKAQVHAALALGHRKNPGISLSVLFRRNPNIVPLGHAAFTPLANALAAL